MDVAIVFHNELSVLTRISIYVILHIHADRMWTFTYMWIGEPWAILFLISFLLFLQ